MALGASNWRMLRQLTVEGVLLSGMGAAAGIALAYFTLPWLVRVAGSSLPAGARISIDSHVLLFTCTVSVCVGLFFGVAPLGTLRSVNVRSALSDNERGSVSRGVKRLRNVLVVTEVCFAVLLLIGAGLFLRTMDRLSDVSLGFSGENILIADLPTSSLGPDAGTQAMDFYDAALSELRKLPGVEATGAASFLPVSGQGSVIHFNIQGRPPHNAGEYIMANYRTASAGYFEALRIPLLQGRWITDADREGSPAVVVINRSMAQTYFRDQSPLANVVLPVRLMSVLLRTHGDPSQSATSLRAAIHRLNPNQPVVRLRTMQENVGQNFTQPRFRTMLLVLFAGLALVIAAVGIYGVMAYSTQQRSAEMAIRMALGSSAERIFLLVVKDGLRLTALGAATGMVLGLVFGRYIKSLLFGIESTDAATLVLALVLALITGMAASVLPARRASRVGIAETLRHS
jgi:predicted lysophospholipase L1 biosynthesis ABC-type transport system permease subunit